MPLDATASQTTPVETPPRLGPNLLESFGWVGLYFLLQNLALAATVGLIVFAAFGTVSISLNSLLEFLVEIDLDRSFVLIGVPGLAALLVMFPLIRWRTGMNWREELKLKRPTFQQVLLVLGAVVPLGLLSDAIYRSSLEAWKTYWQIPDVAATPLTHLGELILGTPYPILVVVLALGPAIAEELLFRGLIGRGLTVRRGLVAGVIWTTLLFGAAHAFPPHMLATIPVGLFLHLVYLATGNLWVPILLHFGNNLLWVSLARYQFVDHLPGTPLVLLTACVYLAIIARALQTRSHTPPPAWLIWRRPTRDAVFAAMAILNFTLTFVLNAVQAGE
jgi:membrane protease YdiL (CAAX protease family)